LGAYVPLAEGLGEQHKPAEHLQQGHHSELPEAQRRNTTSRLISTRLLQLVKRFLRQDTILPHSLVLYQLLIERLTHFCYRAGWLMAI
jgi:ribosomal protein S4